MFMSCRHLGKYPQQHTKGLQEEVIEKVKEDPTIHVCSTMEVAYSANLIGLQFSRMDLLVRTTTVREENWSDKQKERKTT